VLLDALEAFGGTLVFVSHDRYFVDKLATKVISIGGGEALMYPGTYEEFLWSQKQRESGNAAVTTARPVPSGDSAPVKAARSGSSGAAGGSEKPRSANASAKAVKAPAGQQPGAATSASPTTTTPISYDERKRQESEARKARKVLDARRKRIEDLETRIADREQAIKEIEAIMAAPGFYDNHETAKPIIDKHQALMWEVGDLMHQWEELQQTDL
jgi:ATP-binding cassette subfamily F protein 3